MLMVFSQPVAALTRFLHGEDLVASLLDCRARHIALSNWIIFANTNALFPTYLLGGPPRPALPAMLNTMLQLAPRFSSVNSWPFVMNPTVGSILRKSPMLVLRRSSCIITALNLRIFNARNFTHVGTVSTVTSFSYPRQSQVAWWNTREYWILMLFQLFWSPAISHWRRFQLSPAKLVVSWCPFAMNYLFTNKFTLFERCSLSRRTFFSNIV